jgi:hypothetical protein
MKRIEPEKAIREERALRLSSRKRGSPPWTFRRRRMAHKSALTAITVNIKDLF